MPPIEVWYVIPAANPELARETLPEWRERGYRIALLQDQQRRFDAVADVIVAPFDRFRGYGQSINHLMAHVVPRSAPIVVTGGDDMFPDMAHTAQEIAEEFLERFPDAYGLMQPIGDRYSGVDKLCGSPWIGREFARRANGGVGPYWPEYFQYFEDQELHDVAERLGILWKRPDLSHYHKHWARMDPAAAVPDRLKDANARFRQSWDLFLARQAEGFPGSDPLPAPQEKMTSARRTLEAAA